MRRVETDPSIPQRVLWWIAAAFVVVIPLYVSPRADDVFRLPKELLLRAEGILIVAVVAASVIWQPREFRDFLFDRVTGLGVAACAFATVIATALSTNRAISAISAAYVLSCIVAFWGVYIGAAGRSLTAVVVVGSAAGIVNALIAIVQRLGWWNPFQFDPSISDRMQITALVGNPNDTGASLAVCFVALAAFVCIKRRAVPAGTALLLLIGAVASDALTAMLAVAAAGAVLAVLASRRALLSVGIIALAFVSLVATLPALRARAALYTAAARARDYDLLTDHRIVGYMTAWMIFRDHPLTGAGPGTFKWHYLPYRLQVEAHHPEYYLKMNESLGEVHSDHLQVLSEEGAIGYTCMLIAVLVLGSRSLALKSENGEQDERRAYVRLCALPLAVCFVVLAAAGFPLELAAVTSRLLFFAGALLRWSHDALAA